jgi:hypothetical protein
LGYKSPTKTSELLDISTNFATGEEAVGAIFPDAKGKRKEDAAEGSPSHNPKKKKKKGSTGKQRPPHCHRAGDLVPQCLRRLTAHHRSSDGVELP